MESLEPAPTEEGFYLGGQIEKVLSELKEEAQPVQLRRYSRSFSEPNLFQHFMKVTIGGQTLSDLAFFSRKQSVAPKCCRCSF